MTDISFVIPSIDRKSELQNCISSIEKAFECREDANLSIEIIVVFNGGLKDASFLNVKHSSFTSFYFTEERNVSKARNLGTRKSTGAFLVFIDDDAAISTNFLNVLYKNILNHNGVQVFYGRLLDPLNNKPFTHIYEMTEKRYLSHFDYRHSGGTTLAVRRNVLDAVGSYNEQFGPGGEYPAAEESDLFFRMIQAGEKILYLPELVIFHPVAKDTSSTKVYNYSRAIGAMLMKQIIFDPRRRLLYLLMILTIAVKSGVRSLQNILLPETIKEKNERFKYASAFNGVLKGVVHYAKGRGR